MTDNEFYIEYIDKLLSPETIIHVSNAYLIMPLMLGDLDRIIPILNDNNLPFKFEKIINMVYVAIRISDIAQKLRNDKLNSLLDE